MLILGLRVWLLLQIFHLIVKVIILDVPLSTIIELLLKLHYKILNLFLCELLLKLFKLCLLNFLLSDCTIVLERF